MAEPNFEEYLREREMLDKKNINIRTVFCEFVVKTKQSNTSKTIALILTLTYKIWTLIRITNTCFMHAHACLY